MTTDRETEASAAVVGIGAEEAFCEALDRYIHFKDTEPGATNTAHTLLQLCGAVWNISKAMPLSATNDVRDAIENWVEADQWETNGRTYAGAAQRIHAVLKLKLVGN